MLDFGYYNMDCLEGMKEFPDNYFDLAIADPPYGLGGALHFRSEKERQHLSGQAEHGQRNTKKNNSVGHCTETRVF